jgi:hypothetical protein
MNDNKNIMQINEMKISTTETKSMGMCGNDIKTRYKSCWAINYKKKKIPEFKYLGHFTPKHRTAEIKLVLQQNKWHY